MNIQEIRAQYPQYADISDRELLSGLHKKFYSDIPLEQFFNKVGFDQRGRAFNQVLNDPITQGALNPVSGMSTSEKVAAGAGKAITEVGQGAAQSLAENLNPIKAGPFAVPVALVREVASRLAPTRQEVQEQRDRDIPLMATKAGMGGNIVGSAALGLLAAPAGASLPAAALTGATFGASQPLAEGESRPLNTAIGTALNTATQAGMGMLPKGRQLPAPTVRDETFRAGQQEGYVVPPSSMSDSWLARRMESVAGKAAVGQEAAVKNQPVTDRLARQAAGLAPDEQITPQTLKLARDRISRPYQELSAVSPRAGQLLEEWRQTNFHANLYFKSPNPVDKKEAFRLQAHAKQLEQAMDQEAVNAGKPQLVPKLKAARVALAKNFDIEEAVNKGSGEVDASVIGRMFDAGKKMSGELETIGKFQQAFRPYVKEGGLVPTPGVSKIESVTIPGMAAAGASMAGSPAGAIAGGLPLLSGPMRSLLLSNSVQDALANPSAGMGMLRGPLAKTAIPPSLVQAYLSQQQSF